MPAEVKRKCPGCGTTLGGITTDWCLAEKTINGHQVATIGTARGAPEHLRSTVRFQIASNRAAYELDYDFKLNLGFRGTAWVQCPSQREKITRVCFPK